MSALASIPVVSGQARGVERPRATPAVRPPSLLHAREAGQGRQASAARAFGLVLPLALAGCTKAYPGAQAFLSARGFTQIATTAEPWLGGACAWGESLATRFSATRNRRRMTGALCAETADAKVPVIRGLREVPVPAWDSFGSAY